MKNAKKVIALLLGAVLLMGVSIVGTVAYLTSQDTVENTFTVGNIVIKLDEAVADTDGVVADATVRTSDGNEYHLLPNLTYSKDPTVWVQEGSEEAYIRMIVTVQNYEKLKEAVSYDAATYIDGDRVKLEEILDISTDWTLYKFDATAGTYEYRYTAGAYTATANNGNAVEDYDKLAPLFTEIKVPAEIDNAHLAKLNEGKITITAHAIQAAGFADADAAWLAFDGI